MSMRDAARANHISHTKLYDMKRLLSLAESRGIKEQLHDRIMAGEKLSALLNELMPDVLECRKVNQQINQYRSTTRWLLKNGFDADDLIQFIREQL